MLTANAIASLTEYQRNIVSVYVQANALDIQQGMSWYKNAHEIGQQLAYQYGYLTHQAIGVLAALSPLASWELNVKRAEAALSQHKHGLTAEESKGCGMKANTIKAWRILNGEEPLDVLGGNKVRAFYCCMVHYLTTEHVCIDRHAVSIAVGKPLGNQFTKYVNTDVKYAAIAKDYMVVADILSITPAQLQAVTWVTWRRLQNGKVDSFM